MPQQVAPRTTPTIPQQPNSYLEFLRFYLFYFGAIMALPGTPVGDLIHRRALSSANRPGDPYHHPLGAMNPQFATITQNCRVCLVLKHFGSCFVQVFVHFSLVWVWARGHSRITHRPVFKKCALQLKVWQGIPLLTQLV